MTDKHSRFLKLGWEILEHKCRYYVLLNQTIADHAFDKLQAEYDALSTELGESPTAADMVDFDMSRPCCKLVYEKLTAKAPKSSRPRRKQKK